jgi:hypothetical protein
MKDIFDPITVKWFKRAIGKPTKVQEEAWPVIAAGHNTLVFGTHRHRKNPVLLSCLYRQADGYGKKGYA